MHHCNPFFQGRGDSLERRGKMKRGGLIETGCNRKKERCFTGRGCLTERGGHNRERELNRKRELNRRGFNRERGAYW